jgi:Domain of unknown function (DUF4389)
VVTAEPSAPDDANRPPIRLTVSDDLQRRRLTVFFRLLLAIPHYVWASIWTVGAIVAAIISWFATLVRGETPVSLHDFLARYVRYLTHLYAYLILAADPYPPFDGRSGRYPIDLEVDPPARQHRGKTAVRIVLAIPALMIANALLHGGGFAYDQQSNSTRTWVAAAPGGAAFTVAFLAWFACLARGQMPRGFRDLQAYCLRYAAQAWGYLLLLSDRYPNSDPADPAAAPPEPAHSVAITVADDLRRSRLTVFFRLLLFLPHLVWFLLWGLVVIVALVVSWIVTLLRGRQPKSLNRFLSAYLRYRTHIFAFLGLVANPFPGFVGRAGSYPVDLDLPEPERQNRWKTLFRLILYVPAALVSGAIGGAAFVAAILGWFASLATGRMPAGLRNLGALSLRYSAQADAYLYMLTDRYAYSGPYVPAAALPEPQETVAPA